MTLIEFGNFAGGIFDTADNTCHGTDGYTVLLSGQGPNGGYCARMYANDGIQCYGDTANARVHILKFKAYPGVNQGPSWFIRGGTFWNAISIRVPTSANATTLTNTRTVVAAEIHQEADGGPGPAPFNITYQRGGYWQIIVRGSNTTDSAFIQHVYGPWNGTPDGTTRFQSDWANGGNKTVTNDEWVHFRCGWKMATPADGDGFFEAWALWDGLSNWRNIVPRVSIPTCYPGHIWPLLSCYYPVGALNSNGVDYGGGAYSDVYADLVSWQDNRIGFSIVDPPAGSTRDTPSIVGSSFTAGGAGSATVSGITVPAGADLMVCDIPERFQPVRVNSVIYTPTGGSGLPLTQACSFSDSANNLMSVSSWYLKQPPTGTGALAVTTSSGSHDLIADVNFYTDVDQAAPISNATGAAGSGGSPSLLITAGDGTIAHGILGVVQNSPSTFTITAGGSATEIWNQQRTATNGIRAQAEFKAHSGASTTLQWTTTGANWSVAGYSIMGSLAAVPGNAAQSTVDVDETEVYADGSSAASVTVTIKDVNGNPLGGIEVELTADSTNAEISPSSTLTTDVLGKAVFQVVGTVIETVEFTAEDVTDTVTVTETVSVDFIEAPVITPVAGYDKHVWINRSTAPPSGGVGPTRLGEIETGIDNATAALMGEQAILKILLANGCRIQDGLGPPEGVVAAPPSSIYLRRDQFGIWAKETGVGRTGWVRLIGTPSTPATYTATNVTPDRSYNANSTTTDELADVLGTLISDLRDQEILE